MKTTFKQINSIEYQIRNDIATLSNSKSIVDIQTLHQSIKTNLDRLKQAIKDASTKIYEKSTKSPKLKQYEKELSYHKEEYNNLMVLQRKLNLQVTVNLQEKYKQERRELLSGGSTNLLGQSSRFQNGTKEDIIKSSMNITESLRRTRTFMNSQVTRSSQIMDELDDASKVLDKTLNQQKEYGSKTMEAKSLLTNLKRRDRTDKLLICFGLLLFLLVVVYILKKRFGNRIFSILVASAPPEMSN
ncbi:sec20 family protein [Cavenderia fasciculata]|uniref:Sec20 family protein n=1 Tax=Cavenderia fasciculata TaxID=261658 RepID=F4Q4B5_CACFS|nr:sec20 family protein [Cavenderia fasciculata]EGG16977.1 sec20 family protein [Cavenderia fasciculata]|eukprot:XP_004355459.1 sec20 family protein [Cavenderia fasciculata]